MQVRVLGAHNLETNTTHHTCFLVDGVLAIDAGSLASTLGADEQRRVSTVLLTHLHFDHARDLPTLGLATIDEPTAIDVFGEQRTLDSVRAHLLDGEVYPDLTRGLNEGPPSLRFCSLNEGEPLSVGGLFCAYVRSISPKLNYWRVMELNKKGQIFCPFLLLTIEYVYATGPLSSIALLASSPAAVWVIAPTLIGAVSFRKKEPTKPNIMPKRAT